jgi:hypothetical protein
MKTEHIELAKRQKPGPYEEMYLPSRYIPNPF